MATDIFHPWNTGFSWRDHDGHPTTILGASQRDQFDREGFTVIPRAFDAETIARLNDELLAAHRSQTGEIGEAELSDGVSTEHASTFLREFCAHPLLASLARDLVGPNVQLLGDRSLCRSVTEPHAEPWHQDNAITFLSSQFYLTCWIALIEIDPQDGGLWVAPRVHRSGTIAHVASPTGDTCAVDTETAIYLPIRAGDIVAISSLTPYASEFLPGEPSNVAYMVQFAPEGAALVSPDEHGDPCSLIDLRDSNKRFPVVVDGRLVGPH